MNNPAVGNRGAHRTGAIAVVLAATLVALLAVFALAKPSGAQVEVVDPVTLEVQVDPVSVDFGTVVTDDRVVGHIATRTITVKNTGDKLITIGGVELVGAAGEVADFSADLGSEGRLEIAAGETATFEVTFDPSAEGARKAVLTFTEGAVDGAIAEVIKLVNDAGQTVIGIDLSGTGDGQLPAGATPDCTKIGSNEGETLRGTSGPDVICALGGRDKVYGLRGNDKIRGGSGADRVLKGGRGADRLLGQAGGDRVIDRAGKDRLYGHGGRDTLVTKDGNRGDLLVGGPRRDTAIKDRGDRARSI